MKIRIEQLVAICNKKKLSLSLTHCDTRILQNKLKCRRVQIAFSTNIVTNYSEF